MVMSPTEIGNELTAVTMGIDRFERRRPKTAGLLDGEGLVPIFIGDDLVSARDYANWDAINADLDKLDAVVATLPDGPRAVFLRGMMKSLRVAVRLFAGASPSFEEKVRDLVGAPVGPVDPAVIDDIRDRLDQLLARQGVVRGSLGARIHAWEESRFLEDDKLEAVFEELMREAKTRTDAQIFDTGDFSMVLNPVRDVPFTARCGFVKRAMDLN